MNIDNSFSKNLLMLIFIILISILFATQFTFKNLKIIKNKNSYFGGSFFKVIIYILIIIIAVYAFGCSSAIFILLVLFLYILYNIVYKISMVII